MAEAAGAFVSVFVPESLELEELSLELEEDEELDDDAEEES